MREFKSEAEVEALWTKEQKKIVLFEGSVYDVSEYGANHPGGEHYISDNYGKNIDDQFEEAGHSKASRLIFRDLPLVGYIAGAGDAAKASRCAGFSGTVQESKFPIDLDKAILPQIHSMKNIDYDEYVNWINEPKHLINPVRDVIMFDTPLVEYFSKTPWYRVPVLYVTMTLWELYTSQVSVLMTIQLFLAGIFIWTWWEYVLHRFAFHAEDKWLPRTNQGIAFHFTFHGIHHAFPMDKYRLVFPIHASPPFFVLFAWVYAQLMPAEWVNPVLAGTAIGYLSYDMIHYFTHHFDYKCAHLQAMK
jgi:4-hydroxysphinganine ceramide fatty acyl 2-hydroxylase